MPFGLLDPLKRVFGFRYDAVLPKNRRQAPDGILRSEDTELMPQERRQLLSGSRNIYRNFALAAWMIRRHLDYVSAFSFQAKTGNDALDERLEELIAWWSRPENCDIAGRHSLPRLTRMAEARRTIDGDVFLLKVADGRIQAIEGDRIRTPAGGVPDTVSASDFVHGVKVDASGAATAYCVCQRGPSGDMQPGNSANFVFERVLPATNVYHHAYFDRFDQVRGISPLAAAINTLRDTYEGFDYALAKMKVSQLFGLVFYRGDPNAAGDITAASDGAGYEVDFHKGPVQLDLDPGDRAEFLESKNPSTEFQSFSQTMISVALKALDLPYSFYAENFTNYSGARQALLQYEQAAEIKRSDVRQMLDVLTEWRFGLFLADGLLPGVDASELRWEWVPKGLPWIDPLKEVQANIAAISSGLYSRTRALKEQGIDFYEVADEIAAENEYLSQLGLPTNVQPSNAQIVEVAANAG